jgi:2-C-methyl-D-erythritol 4-phosphate cytidylyltransferase
VAIVLGAGAGTRLGAPTSKAFVPLAGRPLLAHALERVASVEEVEGVVLVVAEGDVGRARVLAAQVPGLRVEAVVPGGRTRQESVRLGLEAVPAGARVVVCHDAARPFATPELFRRVLLALRSADGAVPVVPSTDSVKRVRDGLVVESLPREEVAFAQTPQAFRAPALREAHRLALRSGLEATDDAALVEAAGFSVVAVEGEASNFKVTTPEDLARAEQVLASGALLPAAPGAGVGEGR